MCFMFIQNIIKNIVILYKEKLLQNKFHVKQMFNNSTILGLF